MTNKPEQEPGSSESQVKSRKHRSPNYPVIGLQKATELTKVLYDAYKRNQVPVELVHQKWSYKAHGGVGNQTVAALKSYDLIDVDGSGKNRTIKISERAYKILENHPDRKRLLQESALKPLVYQELWEQYGAGALPDNEIIRHYLKFDRNFNPSSIDGIIGDFRDTFSFVELNIGDKIVAHEEGGSSHNAVDSNETPPIGFGNKPSVPPIMPPKGLNMATDTFTLGEGTITFQYPISLSEESFDDLEAWMKLQLKKIQRSIITAPGDDPSTNEG
ncbi:MAG: hypothetical protein KAV00_13840 [Phycisphaerae bacterium]|nr:hypothetical protein [Phycisphaerae bacterium]